MSWKNYLKRIWGGLAPGQGDTISMPRFAPSPAVRRRLVFEGRVQGVGFRFEVMQLAGELGLTGWVMNRDDGSVEAEVQGEDERISFLIRYMKSLKRISIQSLTVEELPLIPDETEFDVRWE